jgi:hypothetical protein
MLKEPAGKEEDWAQHIHDSAVAALWAVSLTHQADAKTAAAGSLAVLSGLCTFLEMT